MITAVMLGGPADGQVLTVTGDPIVWEFGKKITPVPDPLPETSPRQAPAEYRLGKVTAFGRVIAVGYLGEAPDDGDLFRLLISRKGKDAAAPKRGST